MRVGHLRFTCIPALRTDKYYKPDSATAIFRQDNAHAVVGGRCRRPFQFAGSKIITPKASFILRQICVKYKRLHGWRARRALSSAPQHSTTIEYKRNLGEKRKHDVRYPHTLHDDSSFHDVETKVALQTLYELLIAAAINHVGLKTRRWCNTEIPDTWPLGIDRGATGSCSWLGSFHDNVMVGCLSRKYKAVVAQLHLVEILVAARGGPINTVACHSHDG